MCLLIVCISRVFYWIVIRRVADTVRCGYLLQDKTVVNRMMLRWSRNCRQISLYARMHFGRNFIASREVPYSPRLKLVKHFLAETCMSNYGDWVYAAHKYRRRMYIYLHNKKCHNKTLTKCQENAIYNTL